MINVDQEYTREVECEYKGERYKVRDNGAIYRIARIGKSRRSKDEHWTFGETVDKGYAKFCGESVHRIVAVAFLGEPPTKQHVVDHLDTNRQNNRPENLRWLTKLENILLNPYTKAKIEYLCGSVEEFLKEPSKLRGHEGEDANFSWMRAVTPQEAKNTLANWNSLLSKPRPVSRVKGNAIEEWIFDQNHPVEKQSKPLDLDDPFDFHQGYATVDSNNNVSSLSSNNPRTPDEGPVLSSRKKSKPEMLKVSKTDFMSTLCGICERENLKYEKYHKTDKWRSDVLIYVGEDRIAISSFSSFKASSDVLQSMEEDGVKAFGLVLSPKMETYQKSACFGLYKSNGDAELQVKVGENSLSLSAFVKKCVEGKIALREDVTITSVDVMFCETDCYVCGTPHSVFFVRYLVGENGRRYDYYRDSVEYADESIEGYPDLQFGDEILALVKDYIAQHPEKKIVMGPIKSRFSKTRDESYLSFGCPVCDALVGDYYLDEIHIDYIYKTDETLMNRIHLRTPLKLTINEWLVME